MQAAVYVRISSDPEGLRAGVERQRQDCLDECERRGWQVVVFEDNDVSAYRGKASSGLPGDAAGRQERRGRRHHRLGSGPADAAPARTGRPRDPGRGQRVLGRHPAGGGVGPGDARGLQG